MKYLIKFLFILFLCYQPIQNVSAQDVIYLQIPKEIKEGKTRIPRINHDGLWFLKDTFYGVRKQNYAVFKKWATIMKVFSHPYMQTTVVPDVYIYQDEKNNLLGITDSKGKILLPPAYTKIEVQKKIIAVHDGHQWKFLQFGNKKEIRTDASEAIKLSNYGYIFYKENGCWGIKDDKFNVVKEAQFKSIQDSTGGKLYIENFATWSYEKINATPNPAPIEFPNADSIKLSNLSDELMMIYRNGKVGIGNKASQENVLTLFDSAQVLNKKFGLGFQNNNLVLIHSEKKLNVETEEQKISNINTLGNFVIVTQKNKNQIVLNASGDKIKEGIWNSVSYVSDTLLALKDSIGELINEKGESVWQGNFQKIYPTNSRGILIENDSSFLFITHDLKNQYTHTEAFLRYYGFIGEEMCKEDSGIGFHIDVTPWRYEKIKPIGNGFYQTYNGPHTGMIDSKGFEILTCYNDSIQRFLSDSIFVFYRDSMLGFADAFGISMPLTKKIQELQKFHEGYARHKRDGLYGFVDKYGNDMIAARYENAGIRSGNRCAICIRGKWGFVDPRENIKIQPIYDEVYPFKGLFTVVRRGKKFAFVNNEGKAPNSLLAESWRNVKSGKIYFKKQKFWGILNEKGEEKWSAKFESIEECTPDTFIVKQDGNWGVVGINQNYILFPEFIRVYYIASKNLYLCGRQKKGSLENISTKQDHSSSK